MGRTAKHACPQQTLPSFCQIPLDNVERLWQELEAFETNLNRITAKKFMADISPAHMQAHTVLRQLVNRRIW